MSRLPVLALLLSSTLGCFSQQTAETPPPASKDTTQAAKAAPPDTPRPHRWPEQPASHVATEEPVAPQPDPILDDEWAFAEELAKLMDAAGELEGAGDFVLAEEKRREILERLERRYGAKSWQATNGRLALTHVLRLAELSFEERGKLVELGEAERWSAAHAAQGQAREALAEAQRAVRLTQEVWGEDYYLLANRWFDVAQLHHLLGEHEAAEKLYIKTLAFRRSAFGPEHPECVAVLVALSGHYQATRQLDKAERTLQEAAELDKVIWGELSTNYALQLNNLGMLHHALGKRSTAVGLLRQAADIRRAAVGERHVVYAHSLYNLASVHHAAQDFDEAAPLFEQALQNFEAELGAAHQMTLLTKNNLAMLELAQKNLPRAETLLAEVVAATREQAGNHPAPYASALQQLAVVYSHELKYREADELLAEAQKLQEQSLGANHPQFAQSLELRAAILRRAKRVGEAERLEAWAKEIGRKAGEESRR